jgi:hypothetical protein
MTSTNGLTGRSGIFVEGASAAGVTEIRLGRRGFGAGLLVYGAIGLFSLSGAVALSACKQDAEGGSPSEAGHTATIQVISGNGRLAGGEEYEIAEWRSGVQPAGGGYYADFRGQDGGPTLDLSLRGLDKTGEFACGEAMAASLELRVDVNNAYRAAPEAPCRVEVTRLADGVIEGHYTATLRHSGNPADEMTVAGSFRATQPGSPAEAVDIQAAKGPKVGLR